MDYLSLRPYQQKGVDEIRHAFTQYQRVVYQLPTGGGKTVIFSFIARAAAAKGKRVLICTHRKELVHQTAAKLGMECGYVTAGMSIDYSRPLQIGTIQTLVNRDCPAADLVILDECHHCTSDTWREVLSEYPNAKVLGVTATPCRLDGTGLKEIFEYMVLGPTMRELIDLGFLAKYEAYCPGKIDLAGVRTQRGDYNTGDLEKACNTAIVTGSAIEYYRKLADGLPAIAFCVSVNHAKDVAAQFREAGYTAESIDGTMSQEERQPLLKGLADGSLQILTSCELISEGIDVPAVTAGILIRPTQSLGMALQQMGRVLRPSPDKDHAIIIDHAGNCLEHGLPDDHREWTLEGRPKKKRGEKKKPEAKYCEVCFHISPPLAKNCIHCGTEFPFLGRKVEEIDGELVKMNGANSTGIFAALPYKKALQRAYTPELLRQMAAERGYKRGWVNHILIERALKETNKAGV